MGVARGSGETALRVGIVGAGFIGDVHARAARRAGARVVGIVASTPERTEEAAARVGAERTFGDGLELITSGELRKTTRGLCRQASRSFAAVLRMMPIADHGLTFVDCRNVISTVSFVGHSVSGTVAERRTDEVRHVDRKPTCTGERTGSRRSYRDRGPDGDCRR